MRKYYPGRTLLIFFILAAVVLFFPVFFKMRASLFPMEYRLGIFAQGEKNEIDPLLIAAVIFRESHFRPGQISGQGDRGLMQIQPNTLIELERVKLMPKGQFTADDLLNSGVNIEVGTLYMRYLRDKIMNSPSRRQKVEMWYGGDVWPFVLASYNAGPTFVLNQLVDPSESKTDYEKQLRLKRLSTSNYVDDILRYYHSLVWMNRVYDFKR